MPFDPLHDYADPHVDPPEGAGPCDCAACAAAGVEHAKVMVLEDRVVEGRSVTVGRYLHGYELRRWLAQREAFRQFRQQLTTV